MANRWPSTDHLGRPYTSASGKAGEPILQGMAARFCSWKGDMEARVAAHELHERQYSSLTVHYDLCIFMFLFEPLAMILEHNQVRESGHMCEADCRQYK